MWQFVTGHMLQPLQARQGGRHRHRCGMAPWSSGMGGAGSGGSGRRSPISVAESALITVVRLPSIPAHRLGAGSSWWCVHSATPWLPAAAGLQAGSQRARAPPGRCPRCSLSNASLPRRRWRRAPQPCQTPPHCQRWRAADRRACLGTWLLASHLAPRLLACTNSYRQGPRREPHSRRKVATAVFCCSSACT